MPESLIVMTSSEELPVGGRYELFAKLQILLNRLLVNPNRTLLNFDKPCKFSIQIFKDLFKNP
jgi:hypothetical protein